MLTDAVMLLPVTSCTVPAPIEAVTVPGPVMPRTDTSKVVSSLGAICVITTESVPVAVPPKVMSVLVKVEVLTGSLNITVNRIGLVSVGSTCAMA